MKETAEVLLSVVSSGCSRMSPLCTAERLSTYAVVVQEIMVGFRTPSGYLQTMQSLQTIKIPSMIRGKPHAWDPLLCLDWGHKFLEFLKTSTAPGHLIQNSEDDSDEAGSPPRSKLEENCRRVWRVKFTPREGIQSFELDEDTIVAEVCGGDNTDVVEQVERVGFLPVWYFESQVKAVERRMVEVSRASLREDDQRPNQEAPTPQSEHGHARKQEPLARGSPTKVAGWQI